MIKLVSKTYTIAEWPTVFCHIFTTFYTIQTTDFQSTRSVRILQIGVISHASPSSLASAMSTLLIDPTEPAPSNTMNSPGKPLLSPSSKSIVRSWLPRWTKRLEKRRRWLTDCEFSLKIVKKLFQYGTIHWRRYNWIPYGHLELHPGSLWNSSWWLRLQLCRLFQNLLLWTFLGEPTTGPWVKNVYQASCGHSSSSSRRSSHEYHVWV